MGEYRRPDNSAPVNDLLDLTRTVNCLKSDQNHWIENFVSSLQTVETLFTSVIKIQQLHMDVIWNCCTLADGERKKEFLDIKRNESKHLEENILLMKSMLKQILLDHLPRRDMMNRRKELNLTISEIRSGADTNEFAPPRLPEESTLTFPEMGEFECVSECNLKKEIEEGSCIEPMDDERFLPVMNSGYSEDQSSSYQFHWSDSYTMDNDTDQIETIEHNENDVTLVLVSDTIKEEWNTRLSDDEDFLTETNPELEWIDEEERCTRSTTKEARVVLLPLPGSKATELSSLNDKGYGNGRHIEAEDTNEVTTENNIDEELIPEEKFKPEKYMIRPSEAELDKDISAVCTICGAYYKSEDRLKKHMQKHPDKPPYKCVYCRKIFQKKRIFLTHMKLHTDGNKYKCTVCERIFDRSICLLSHAQKHWREACACTICDKKFECRVDLDRHMRLHAKKDTGGSDLVGRSPYECSICKKTFDRNDRLIKHMSFVHCEKPFKCTYCERKFTHKKALVSHLRLHRNKPFKCTKCNISYDRSSYLATHVRRSHGGKKEIRNRKLIIRTGSKKKPSQRKILVKKLPMNSPSLNGHALTAYAARSHECKVCKENFSCGSHLADHMLKHNDGKRSKCNVPKKKVKALARNANSSLKCISCEKSYAPGKLMKHMRIHTNGQPYKCTVCGKRFCYFKQLQSCMQKHKGKQTPKCLICRKSFGYLHYVTKHLKFSYSDYKQIKHIPDGTKEEAKDSTSFPAHSRSYSHGKSSLNKSSLSAHVQELNDEPSYECTLCEEKFSLASHLDDHIAMHSNEERCKCKICGKEVRLKMYLAEHMRTHANERPFKCGSCDRSFKRNSNLIQHMRIHANKSRSFKCKICKKSFKQKCNFVRHKLTHANKKLVKYGKGKESSKLNDNLIQNTRTKADEETPVEWVNGERNLEENRTLIENVNPIIECSKENYDLQNAQTNSKGTPFKCKTCQKSFAHKKYLILHMPIHSTHRQHKCTTCKKNFSSQGNLRKHMRIHSGEKPYKCKNCQMRFLYKRTLITHMRNHNREIFSCSICEEQFAQKDLFSEHMLVHAEDTECDLRRKVYLKVITSDNICNYTVVKTNLNTQVMDD